MEIVVLIIGIYGAFELSNYGEDRARRRAEIDILKGCKTELMADLADIEVNIADLEKSRRALALLVEVLENDGSYHDSLSRHFNYTLLPIHFVHSTSSFEMLKAKGLDLVSNQALRTRLVTLYDSQYDWFLQAESEELDEVQYGIRHILPGRFEAGFDFNESAWKGNMVPLDFEALKTDTPYLYFLKTQQNRTRIYIDYFYAQLKGRVESALLALDEELNRLQP